LVGKRILGQGYRHHSSPLYLEHVSKRPIYARAAKDNVGSIRVLEKCGFTLAGQEKGFANARGKEIEEVVMVLE
jgi:RimJ/RimL family protein N-acetyltransferase